mgnify:FL=1
MGINLRQTKDRFIARLLTRYPSLFRAWEKRTQLMSFDDSPWQALQKPLEQCKVALVTTGGIHLKSQSGFDMESTEGDCSFREIPADIKPEDLTITHNYYDHLDADQDHNIILPLDPLKSLLQSGEIGAVNHRHFSFMGHILKNKVMRLIEVTAPQVSRMFKEDGVDVVILSPG